MGPAAEKPSSTKITSAGQSKSQSPSRWVRLDAVIAQVPRRCPVKWLPEKQTYCKLNARETRNQRRTSRRSGVTSPYFLRLHLWQQHWWQTKSNPGGAWLVYADSIAAFTAIDIICDVTKTATAALAASKGRLDAEDEADESSDWRSEPCGLSLIFTDGTVA